MYCPEFHPLYLGQVIRIFEIEECAVGFCRPLVVLGPQRDRTEGRKGEHVEDREGTLVVKSGFRISAKIGK